LLLKRDNILAAAFSPDSRRLVTSSNAGLVQVWDVAGGALLSQPMTQPADAGCLGISPDGERAAFAGSDGSVYLWDLARSRLAAPPLRIGLVAHHIAFSPDGSRVATASADGTARVWDAANGMPRTPPLKHAQGVWRLAFSPDGSRLLTASLDGTARLWEVSCIDPPLRHLWHAGEVRHASVSRDSRRVVTASDDRTARIWDLDTCRLVAPPLKHDGPVSYAAFDADAKRVVTSGRLHFLNQDIGQAGVWDARTGAPLRAFIGGPAHQARFSPNGRRLVLCLRYQVNVWDFDQERAIAGINNGTLYKSACFSPDGERVLALGWYNGGDPCNLYMTQDGKRLTPRSDVLVTHAEFRPDGRRYVIATRERYALEFDTATLKPVGQQVFHNGPLTHVAYSPDGTRFATCSEDQTARVWDAETCQPLTPSLRHEGKPERVFFHPDGRRLATLTTLKLGGRPHGQMQLWDALTGEALTPPLRHDGPIHHAEFSGDGRFLVCACADSKAWVWRLSAGDERSTEELLLLSEILSGERREPRFGSLTLSREDLRLAWQKHAPAPKPLVFTAAEQLAWHDREAATAEAEGQTFTALFHLDRLLAAGPADGTYHLRRGHVYACAGKLEEAERDYARAAKLVAPGKRLDWYVERAAWCKEREQWTAALWYLDRALTGRPADAILHVERGFVHGKLGRKPERIADLKAAVRHGAAPAVMLRLAAEHEQRGEWSDAAALYLRASEKGPVPWHQAGLVCLKANDVAGYQRLCRRYFERLEKVKVSAPQANELAWLCALAPDALPDYTKPQAWLNDALRRLDDSQTSEKYAFLNTLGALLYRAGRAEDAIRTLQKGLALVHGKGSVQDHVFLALAHRRLGHADEERKWRALAATGSAPSESQSPWERIEVEVLRHELEGMK
jgi:WD40 repeat protein